MAIWQYYKSLTPRTRMLLGGGIVVYAISGLFLSDIAEKRLGYTPSDEDRKKLEEIVPKIRTVDKVGEEVWK